MRPRLFRPLKWGKNQQKDENGKGTIECRLGCGCHEGWLGAWGEGKGEMQKHDFWRRWWYTFTYFKDIRQGTLQTDCVMLFGWTCGLGVRNDVVVRGLVGGVRKRKREDAKKMLFDESARCAWLPLVIIILIIHDTPQTEQLSSFPDRSYCLLERLWY